MKFLSFIFFLFLGLWLAGIVLRALLARWLTRKAAEFNRTASQARHRARTRGRAEGDVTVEAAPESKRVNRSVGEYVDFEEVK